MIRLFDLQGGRSATITLAKARELLRICRADELIPDLAIHRHPAILFDGAAVAVGNARELWMSRGGEC